MRIVVWNCNMALHRKWDALRALRPDLAVLPEAASPDVLAKRGLSLDGVSTAWASKAGGTANKGLLVCGFGGWSVERVPEGLPLLDIFLPVRVSEPFAFDLLAVWSFNHRGHGTPTPIADALDRYEPMLARGGLIAGDFNHNTIWDRGDGRRSFAPSLLRLSGLGYRSVYHDETGDDFGGEARPTIYWRNRTEDGPRYHIDYVFEPAAWQHARQAFAVGAYADWIAPGLSDHVPLVADYDEHRLALGATRLRDAS